MRELLFARVASSKQELAHRKKAEEVIEFLDLQAHRHARVSDLPYGIRKKIEIARERWWQVRNCSLLDEPSSGLTTEETTDIAFWIEDIKEDLGITVVMIEHDMKLVNKVSDHGAGHCNEGRFLAEGNAQAKCRIIQDVQHAYLGTGQP